MDSIEAIVDDVGVQSGARQSDSGTNTATDSLSTSEDELVLIEVLEGNDNSWISQLDLTERIRPAANRCLVHPSKSNFESIDNIVSDPILRGMKPILSSSSAAANIDLGELTDESLVY